MSLKLYFAGSIRGGREDQPIYDQFIKYSQYLGCEILTEHVGNNTLSSNGEKLDANYIHDRDLKWIEASNGIIAEVTNPSIGVGYEINYALSNNKPVLVLYGKSANSKRISAMIEGASGKYPYLTIYNYNRDKAGILKAKNAIKKYIGTLS